MAQGFAGWLVHNAISFLYKIPTYYPDKVTSIEEIWYQKHTVGTAVKCDFCADRVDEGLKPACVQACPTEALKFGDLNDSRSEVSQLIKERGGYQLHPELGTNPSVYYVK